jgi:anti-sigma regulatory factor (Ser/Thr protein kinase)
MIITCGLNFQSRASILRSFLALDQKQESKDAIALINTITQEASRNAIIHGQVFVHGETLVLCTERPTKHSPQKLSR